MSSLVVIGDSTAEFMTSSDTMTLSNTNVMVLLNRYITGRSQRDGQLNVEIDNRHPSRSYTVRYFDSLPYAA
jgi:hypothetical protein